MQVCNIQGNSFQGVYTTNNFSPTPIQERMIKTIKNKFVNDTVIYRKGKNFHNFMETKGKNFILTNGDYKDEIKVGIGFINSDGSFVSEQNCGSYPENRLDDVVQQTKKAWHEYKINNISFYVIALAMLGFIITGLLGRK